MKEFLERLGALSKKAAHRVAVWARAFAVWIAPPHRFVASLLGLVFAISLISWAIWDGQTRFVLYFPAMSGHVLRGETRELPRRGNAETRAELLVSEFLLGPRDPSLVPAFPAGSTLESLILRKGRLYVDLGEDAALVPEADLERGIAALRKTLGLGIHQARQVVVTIGGQELSSETGKVLSP